MKTPAAPALRIPITAAAIEAWAIKNYEAGGHWIVETGIAGEFTTLAAAKAHVRMMDEMEANTRYGDEEFATKHALEDIDRTGTKWTLKRNLKGWKRGQVVTMTGFFDRTEHGIFTDGIKTPEKPGGKWEHLYFTDLTPITA
jgi:hypothetical protein